MLPERLANLHKRIMESNSWQWRYKGQTYILTEMEKSMYGWTAILYFIAGMLVTIFLAMIL